MTDHPDRWPAGTPCWVDLMAGDLGRSQAFYSRILGWSYSEGSPEFGGYTSALVGGRQVAGIAPTMPGMEEAPHRWTVYLATDDLAATDRAAAGAGAQQVAAPMEVGPLGSMGLWVDPTGAVFGAWQPGRHTGFDAVDEPGSVLWCDLMTSGYAAAKDFYGSLFDYAYDESGSDDPPYAMFSVPGGERPAGGIGQVGPDTVMSGWTVTFASADVDEAAGLVVEAGGSVESAPSDFAWGRILIARGPDGEQFGLVTPSGGPSDG